MFEDGALAPAGAPFSFVLQSLVLLPPGFRVSVDSNGVMDAPKREGFCDLVSGKAASSGETRWACFLVGPLLRAGKGICWLDESRGWSRVGRKFRDEGLFELGFDAG